MAGAKAAHGRGNVGFGLVAAMLIEMRRQLKHRFVEISRGVRVRERRAGVRGNPCLRRRDPAAGRPGVPVDPDPPVLCSSVKVADPPPVLVCPGFA